MQGKEFRDFRVLLLTTLNILFSISITAQLKLQQEIVQGAGGIPGLIRPKVLTVSPDDRHIVVLSGAEKTLVHFNQDLEKNEIKHVETIYNVDGTDTPFFHDIACEYSVDGNYVYIVSSNGKLIRMKHTGEQEKLVLDTLITKTNHPELDSAHSLMLSPDGNYLYVLTWPGAENDDSSIIVFKIDKDDSSVSHQKTYDNSTFLKNYRTLRISSNGKFAYGCLQDGANSGVSLFNRNDETGELIFVRNYTGGPANNGTQMVSPDFIQFSPDNRFLFVISGGYYIAKYSIDQVDGTLSLLEPINKIEFPEGIYHCTDGINAIYFKGKDKAIITTERDGVSLLNYEPQEGKLSFNKFLDKDISIVKKYGQYVNGASNRIYFTNELANSFSTYALLNDNLLQHIATIRDNQAGVDGLEQPSAMCRTQSGDFIYVTSKDKLAVFKTKTDSNGELEFVQSVSHYYSDTWSDDCTLWGANKVMISPDERNVYVNIQNDVLGFKRDPESGKLEFIQELQKPFYWSQERALAISNNGKFVFIYVNIDSKIAISCYRRDVKTGLLTFNSIIKGDFMNIDGYGQELDMIITGDDRFLYLSSISAEPIAVFEVDIEDGALKHVQTIDFDNKVIFTKHMELNHDEDVLYVAGTGGAKDNIHVFDRDINNGQLSKREINVINNSNEVKKNTSGVSCVRVSPDNRLLYCLSGNVISVFNITQDTGDLRFMKSVFTEDLDDCNLINGTDLIISPSNMNVYVTSYWGNNIINLNPVLCLGNDRWACKRDTVHITSNLFFQNYYWSNGISDADAIDIVEEGQYILDAVSVSGELQSDTINVFFHDLPQLDLGNDTILLPGEQLLVYSGEFKDYYWSDQSTDPYYHFINDGGIKGRKKVCVKVTDDNGCSNTDSINISFMDKMNPKLKDYLLISDNPVKDELSIELITEVDQIIEIELYASNGNRVAVEKVNDISYQLNMNKYMRGLYFVKIYFEGGDVICRKIIKY